ncbi:MAG: hypothetical protein JO301_11505 [Chitinophagaceae bacterium]|nr:hypothetical protein [Chitinophagaceae bacterium]
MKKINTLKTPVFLLLLLSLAVCSYAQQYYIRDKNGNYVAVKDPNAPANAQTGLGSMGSGIVTINDNSFQIEPRTVGNCSQMVPVGWQANSNKEGNALDLWDNNKTMYAGYAILPVNTSMALFYDKELYNKDPARSVLRIMGVITANQFGDNAPHYTEEINEQINGYQLRSFESNNCKGVVLYRVFKGDGFNYSYIEAMRMAVTRKDVWDQKGELVAGIAFKIMCNVQYIQHEAPSFPRSSSLKTSTTKTKKDDYGYNPQRGTEECHNPRTGENHIVTPEMWSNTGPDGPGYYKKSGNEYIKMAPGRS